MMKKPVLQVTSNLDEARQAWIYKAVGKLIGSQLCYEFLEEARDRIAGGVHNVVIDISGVTMLNSTGIGIIASLYNSTKEKGGKIYLIGATEASRRPLAATHVWELLKKCDTLDDLPETL
jgi:anti-anti-sigma factor